MVDFKDNNNFLNYPFGMFQTEAQDPSVMMTVTDVRHPSGMMSVAGAQNPSGGQTPLTASVSDNGQTGAWLNALTGNRLPSVAVSQEPLKGRMSLNTDLMYSPLNVTGVTRVNGEYGPMSQAIVTQNQRPADAGKYELFRKGDGFFEQPAVAQKPDEIGQKSDSVNTDLSDDKNFLSDMEPSKYQEMRDSGMSDADIVKQHRDYDMEFVERFAEKLGDPTKAEGYKDFLYLDTMGNLTYGRGKNVNNDTVFCKMPWQDPTNGALLTPEEKSKRLQKARAAQREVLQRCAESRKNGTFKGKDGTLVDLTADAQKEYFVSLVTMDASAEKEVIKNHLLGETLPALKQNFRELNHPFYSEPPSAQWSEVDLMYNLGPNRFKMDPDSQGEAVRHGWPTLTKSLLNRDYVKAGNASHRSGISEERNDEVKKRFQRAQKEYRYGVRGGPYYYDNMSDYWDAVMAE